MASSDVGDACMVHGSAAQHGPGQRYEQTAGRAQADNTHTHSSAGHQDSFLAGVAMGELSTPTGTQSATQQHIDSHYAVGSVETGAA